MVSSITNTTRIVSTATFAIFQTALPCIFMFAICRKSYLVQRFSPLSRSGSHGRGLLLQQVVVSLLIYVPVLVARMNVAHGNRWKTNTLEARAVDTTMNKFEFKRLSSAQLTLCPTIIHGGRASR